MAIAVPIDVATTCAGRGGGASASEGKGSQGVATRRHADLEVEQPITRRIHLEGKLGAAPLERAREHA